MSTPPQSPSVLGAVALPEAPPSPIMRGRVRPQPVRLFRSVAASEYVLLALVTLCAAGLRAFRLGEWSLWIDEVLTINKALATPLHAIPVPVSLSLIRVAIAHLGTGAVSVRLVPALIGVISIPLLYFPIRKVFTAPVALLSVLLLTLSPWDVYWSQNARFYTALVLFYSVGMFFVHLWLERNRIIYLAVAALVLGLAFFEQYTALFAAPVIAVYMLVLLIFRFELPNGLNRRNAALLIGIGVIGLAYVALSGAWSEFASQFVGYSMNPIRVDLSVVSDIGLPLFILALAGGFFLAAEKNRAGVFLLIGCVVPLILLTLMAPYVLTFSRYVFLTLPVWTTLGAVAARELATQVQKHARVLAFGVLVVLVADPVSQDVLYYTFQNGNREDWKDAFALVQERRVAGELLVTTRPDMADYYVGTTAGAVWVDTVSPRTIEAASTRAWFVLDNRTFVSPELQAWLDRKADLVGVDDVYQAGKLASMRVYVYDPNHTRP